MTGNTTQRVTIEQFRLLADSGAIKEVVLEGIGPAFGIVALLKNKGAVVLRAVNADTVRQYRDPRRALQQLKEMGIGEARIAFQGWDQTQSSI